MVTIDSIKISETEVQWLCRCENTPWEEGFEKSVSDLKIFHVYLAGCLRCGRKFDEQTLEIVGVRVSSDYRNELIPKEEWEQISRQATAYFGSQRATLNVERR